MREHRNLTQQDLADLAGVPLEIVQDIEAGVEDVSVEHVERTYQALQAWPGWERMRPKIPA
jgi:predicted transcriptional regulator